LKAKEAKDAALLQKSSLQLKLLPLSKEDKLEVARLCASAKKCMCSMKSNFLFVSLNISGQPRTSLQLKLEGESCVQKLRAQINSKTQKN
jgi:hypothetical protein